MSSTKLLHAVRVDGESVPAGTEVKYIGPAPKRGRYPKHWEQVEVELPDGTRACIDASAVDAHGFATADQANENHLQAAT